MKHERKNELMKTSKVRQRRAPATGHNRLDAVAAQPTYQFVQVHGRGRNGRGRRRILSAETGGAIGWMLEHRCGRAPSDAGRASHPESPDIRA